MPSTGNTSPWGILEEARRRNSHSPALRHFLAAVPIGCLLQPLQLSPFMLPVSSEEPYSTLRNVPLILIFFPDFSEH